jgi:hypothetical protein
MAAIADNKGVLDDPDPAAEINLLEAGAVRIDRIGTCLTRSKGG